MRQILIVDDEKNIRRQLSGLLADEGYATATLDHAEAALEHLAEEKVDLVLFDVMLPGMSGLDAIEALRERGETVLVIVMSGQATIETAVRATKAGAFDYLEKPLDPERLLVSVRNALERSALLRHTEELTRQIGTATGGLVGSSESMQRLRGAIERAAAAEARVLITGENGTGKELVARALHEGSRRARSTFVKVNCAAIPRELIESELFGHEKGAFTGANSRKIGRVEAADGGSLLLDEVGDMAIEAQAKLLRVLEENEVERVGGTKPIPVDVRVIAATNKDLEKAIQDGEFREDLYYRLNVVPIQVPPLRERKEDIPELVEHFRRSHERDTGRPLREIDAEALDALREWGWPGNVRELRNVIERLEIMTEGDVIGAADVDLILENSRPLRRTEGTPRSESTDGLSLREILEQTERRVIEEALAATGGTVSEAARRLGMDRANLHRKMRRLDIQRPTDDAEDVSE